MFYTLALALTGCIFVLPTQGLPDFDEDYEQSSSRSGGFATSLTDLTLDIPIGEVEVRVGENWVFEATVYWDGPEADEPQLEIIENGGNTTHRWTCTANRNCRIDLEITVPAELASLSVELDVGNVRTYDLSTALDVDVDAGNVELAGHMGDLALTVDAGNIEATNLIASEASATVDAGNVELSFLERPFQVTADADAGDVNIVVPSGAYVVDASVNLGNIDIGEGITEDEMADAAISAAVDIGNITIEGI